MITDIPEFEDLKNYIINNHNGKSASGGTQVTMRCPYCGDSRDPRNRHLYIGPDRKNENILSFHCFLCNSGGIITAKFFRDIGCYDMDLINEVVEYNHSFKTRKTYTKRYERDKRITINPVLQTLDIGTEAFNKLDYINNRLGSNLNFEDAARLKIILNLNAYLKANHIGNVTRYPTIMNELSLNSVGFLSVDNSHVILRTIVDPKTLNPTIARRYNNYSIFVTPNTYLFYVIPGLVDPTKPIKIYITEGVFDILSVYLNVIEDKTNSVFAAAAGKAQYCSLLGYIFTVMQIPSCLSEVHIYSDNDMNMNEYKKICILLNTIKVPLVLHRNMKEGQKDFGVPKDQIIDKVVFI